MNEQSEKDLKALVERRWDPRCGKSRDLRKFNLAVGWVLTFALIAALFYFRGNHFWIVFPIAVVMQISCWLPMVTIRVRTTAKRQEHEGFLCPWCRYPLTGLTDDGICPECGVKYRRKLCEQLYTCAYEPKDSNAEALKAEESRLWREAIELRDGDDDGHPTLRD